MPLRLSARRGLIAAIGLIAPGAWAAPYCVQSRTIPPQCIYVDANECSKRAQQMQGSCSVNPNEIKISSAVSAYCVTDSTRNLQCGFASYDSCSSEASRRHGFCVRVEPSAPNLGSAAFEQIRP